jgi:hypothetical protein
VMFAYERVIFLLLLQMIMLLLKYFARVCHQQQSAYEFLYF